MLTRRVRELTAQVETLGVSTPRLTEPDRRADEHAARVLPYRTSLGQLPSIDARLRISFLLSLLEGRFAPTSAALDLARILDVDPEADYRIGVFLLDLPIPLSSDSVLRRERLAVQLQPLLERLRAPTLYSLSLNRVRVLLPAACPVEQLWQALAAPDLSLVIGQARKGLETVKQGHDEVVTLLPNLEFGRLYRYDELLLARVLVGDATARTAFIDHLFAPLRRCRNGDILIETVLALAYNGFRLNQTADHLHVHPKTIRYRLNRIADCGSLDLDDGETRFRLQLAGYLLSPRDK